MNDIDAVQGMLQEPRLGIAADRITRLVDAQATRDAIRGALERLGSDEVAAGDRVFVHYSGHGTRVEVRGAAGQRFHREAIVPVDVRGAPDDPHLLFDFEINQLLRAIAARTTAVTVVLDCCHASGTWRGLEDTKPRFVDLADLGLRAPVRDTARAATRDAGPGEPTGFGRVGDCHVIAACRGHELAYEARGEDGSRLGLLTRAFTDAVAVAAVDDLATLTWARIWQLMRAAQARRSDRQTLSMHGDPARLVFGGPPVHGDAGIPVRRTERGHEVDAGTLAGVTEGAELAVYGAQPAYFPAPGSRDDRDHRLGVLRVTAASRSAATAEGEVATLPAGARACLVRAGKHARLGYAIEPHDDRLTALLAGSPLLEAIAAPAMPEVKLVRSGGTWFVTDAIHGVRGDEPVLFALPPGDLDHARAVLEHYGAYIRPVQMANRARDLPGELVLDVLRCAGLGALAAGDAQGAELPLAASRAVGSYQVHAGDALCFRVRNRSRHRLHVTLVNTAASGRVQMLGDETIDAGASHTFWSHSELGAPFRMIPPPKIACCADRLVAIGTTADDHDLSYLRVERTFAQIIERRRDAERAKDIDAGTPPPPIIHWTSTQAVIETRRS